MFGNFFKKLFGKKEPPPPEPDPMGIDLGETTRRIPASVLPPPSKPTPPPAAPSAPAGARNLDIPNRLVVGLEMRAVPERQPGTPRAWTVKIIKLDHEGIWVARTKIDEEPIQAQPREVLSLVVFDDRKQLTYDCPVVRVKPGQPEQILVAPPTKSTQEESRLQNTSARKHYRVSFRLPAELRPVRGTEVGAAVSCYTRDISMGGLALESTKPVEATQMVEVRILSWNFPLNVRARVVRTFELSPGVQVIALEFPENLSSISRDLIGQFIVENQKNR